MESDANAEAIEAWNTVLFDKFCRFRDLVTTALACHGDAAMARHAPRVGARVLDVGCGFGDTTRELGRRVGPEGEAVGVDAAPRFIESARRDAEGLKNARFFVADVQFGDLEGPYELAFSRFGTMFFASPVAALRNIRRALTSGGTLAMVVWRRKEDNPWLHAAEQRVLELVQEPEESDEPTCGPGPFSMAGADMVSDILRAAGFARPTFERFDVDICIGRTLDEAVEFAMALGPAGEVIRLAGEEAERVKPQVMEAMRDVLSSFVRSDGVFGPSSSWIISARAE